MVERKVDGKIEETQKVGSYNQFLRRFYPDGLKADKYAEPVEATRLAANSQLSR